MKVFVMFVVGNTMTVIIRTSNLGPKQFSHKVRYDPDHPSYEQIERLLSLFAILPKIKKKTLLVNLASSLT